MTEASRKVKKQKNHKKRNKAVAKESEKKDKQIFSNSQFQKEKIQRKFFSDFLIKDSDDMKIVDILKTLLKSMIFHSFSVQNVQ